jgi:hypothetical protein
MGFNSAFKGLKCEIDLNNILTSGLLPTENNMLLNHQEMAKGAVIQDSYRGDFSLGRRRWNSEGRRVKMETSVKKTLHVWLQ